MRVIAVLLSLFVCMLSHIGYADTHLPSPTVVTQNLDRIVAVVNDGVITQSELDRALAIAKKQMPPAQAAHITSDQLKDMLLQQLINEKLQLQMAKRGNITVSSQQVNQAISRVAKGNHMTLIQLKAKLAAHHVSFSDYKKSLKKQLLIHQVQMSAVASKVSVSDQDVAAFLKKYQSKAAQAVKYHVLDLLVPINSNDQKTIAAAKQKAIALAAKWKKGKNLDLVNTTDLGWQTVDDLPTLFMDQINQMKKGDVAGPLQAPNGFHIIQLAGVKNTHAKMPNKAQIKAMLFQQKFQKAVAKWLKTLRKTAYIHIAE